MELRRRARGAILESAIINVPSGLLIALGMVVVATGARVPVLELPAVAWLAPIGLAWLGVVTSRLLNARHNEQVVIDMLRERYDTSLLKNAQLKQYVEQAIAYRQRIDQQVEKLGDGPMKVKLADVAIQIESWVGQIYSLAQRVEAYRADPLIRNDLLGVQRSVAELKARMARERSESLRADMADTIARRQAQAEALEHLDDTMDRAELQIENTLTALGTVYSQVILVDNRDVNNGRAQRLSEDVNQQVSGLSDLMSSMDEIYNQRKGVAISSAKAS